MGAPDRRDAAEARRTRAKLIIWAWCLAPILDVRVGVDLVDPKTGVVIRPAGAAAISGATYRGRIQAIRATHPDTKPQRLR